MISFLNQYLTRTIEQWTRNRRPRGKSIELNQKRIYIFPTASGWAFLAVCITLFFIATNYQNNLIHAVSFLLISLGVLTIHYTFLNLSGLKITALKAFNCYAGDIAEFRVLVESVNQRGYDSVQLNWRNEPIETVCLSPGESQTLDLNVQSKSRGLLKAGMLKIESRFPFGLLRAWSWIELEMEAIVYPKPHEGRPPALESGDGDGELGKNSSGDDFSGLEEYQVGHSTRHIAWKQYAQGRGLLVKNYLGQQQRHIWLSWEEWPELSGEQRLAVICYWALTFEHESVEYGLWLPDKKIKPHNGPEHLEQVLIALAMFRPSVRSTS